MLLLDHIKSDALRIKSGLDDLVQSLKCAAANKKDIRGIYSEKLLLRMLPKRKPGTRFGPSVYW